MKLVTALDIKKGDVVSFVGAGGKKTAMYRILSELNDKNVLFTTTTHIPTPLLAYELAKSKVKDVHYLKKKLEDQFIDGSFLILGHQLIEDNQKIKGLHPNIIDQLMEHMNIDYVLVKADGASSKPLKVHANDEPRIPKSTTKVVYMLSLEALGKPLTQEMVHRQRLFTHHTGIKIGEEIHIDGLAHLILSKYGAYKHVPDKSELIIVINKVDTVELRKKGEILAKMLLKNSNGRVKKVVLAKVRYKNPVVKVLTK